MATLCLRGRCCASCSKAPHFPSSFPPIMELPFLLLAFLSFLSLAHSHPLYTTEQTSIARPFIHETLVASSRAYRPAQGSTLQPINDPKQEKSFLLDDGAEKKEATISKPFIYESVAASFSSEAHARLGTHLNSNVPQEDNTFQLDDGGGKHVQSGVNGDVPTSIAKPSFIYESVAASFNSKARGGRSPHDSIPEEENVSLLGDGNIEKEVPIIKKGEPIIASSVVDSNPLEAHGDSHLHDNTLQEENSFLLDNGGKHVQSGVEREEPPITKPSYIYESVAALLHSRARKGSLVRNIAPAFLLGNGGENVRKSLSNEASSTQDGSNLLQENVPQEKYAFLRDDGRKKPVSVTQQAGHDGKSKAVLDSVPQEDVQKPPNVQESTAHVKASSLEEGGILLHDNAPQGEHAFLVDDGGKHGSSRTTLKEGTFLHDNVPQGEYSFLLDNGGRKELPSLKNEESKNHMKLPIYHKLRPSNGDLRSVVDDSGNSIIKEDNRMMPGAQAGNPTEENLRMVVGDPLNNLTETGHQQAPSTEGNPNEDSLRMVVSDSLNNMTHKENREAGTEGNPNEDNLRMVVGDSSNNMTQKGQGARGEEGSPPSNEESLRMVVGDSSKKTIQNGQELLPNKEGKSPNEENLRMVVGDASKHTVQRGHQAARGRSRSCAINSNVCQQLADADRMSHIALYGQPNPLAWKQPACCGGVCVDVSNHGMHCGGCGKSCGLSKTCCNGKCTNLNEDSSNCGQCGHSCPSFSPCQYGMCGYY